uniref:Uncharacterized protein n=1 Tax=Noctiluca scintillans TaxID=2966 RepID=A0A7S1AQH8_NOCSC|mmetsp:Transcript_55828/g.148875  ORF Transcript_55828/g.148875 Transcript_55828/m.148875 type:complete len:164 (+) Transcript_55828:87-578(+)|eukprot:CAMPEP_0194504096 /NCGR_PEP_ID=MMETSP0253-20130528/28751_1 /TAXON_ID=2966 /ORGANISM="Noctiluca scintillans" /LENGTH=163 /DNA_ID=CAMNT_0039346447 /DNA_START=80 /DNA_END=571 /DNA_ORIENTATION=+
MTFLGITTGPIEDLCILLSMLMLGVTFSICFCWASEYYKQLPWWGPFRKFDCRGDDNHQQNQFLLVEHMSKLMQEQDKPPVVENVRYGSLGQSTWGHCEVPSMAPVPFMHPEHGPCMLRQNFHETQKMREHSRWWAKDEPHFLREHGWSCPPDQAIRCAQKMV